MWNHSFYERSAIIYRIVEKLSRVFRCFRTIREGFLCEILRDPQCVRCVYADAMRMRTCARATPIPNNWTGAIHEKFSPRNFVLLQNAKVFRYKYLIQTSNCVIYQNCGAATPYRCIHRTSRTFYAAHGLGSRTSTIPRGDRDCDKHSTSPLASAFWGVSTEKKQRRI